MISCVKPMTRQAPRQPERETGAIEAATDFLREVLQQVHAIQAKSKKKPKAAGVFPGLCSPGCEQHRN